VAIKSALAIRNRVVRQQTGVQWARPHALSQESSRNQGRLRGGAQLGGLHANLALIAHAVIAGLKLIEEIAAGIDPGKLDSKHVGAVAGRHAGSYATGDGFAYTLGQVDALGIVDRLSTYAVNSRLSVNWQDTRA
jgi:hypothetical protein